ncbi:hypothetical protein [Egbenema bharatensis]|uniref:hypothetical protein n=1 Tax=Egbenema bharatensis TaxID=3463334 RepID=UPI003A88B478
MGSVILSFVGNQDPFAKQNTEGSIVSLVRYLKSEHYSIDHVVLLHTQRTQINAIDTQQWLLADGLSDLTAEQVVCWAVDEALSEDPIDSLLAIRVARSAVDRVQEGRSAGDWLELNASSGTPAMKAAWGILQAAGYIPNSRVWQVRNPQEMRVGQVRVFQANVNVLRQEFDRQVARRQVQDYNYSGARVTLEAAGLLSPVLGALLSYGRCRLALDFDRAYSAIAPVGKEVSSRWVQEVSRLRQKDQRALLQEAYFNAEVRLRNQEYSQLLVEVFRFQEGVLRYGVGQLVGRVPMRFEETGEFWRGVERVEEGRLFRFLQGYRFRGNALTLEKFPNRPVMMAILEYDAAMFGPVLEVLKSLNEYCEQRNQLVHQFAGISELENAADCLQKMRQVLRAIGVSRVENAFDGLNGEVLGLLGG